MSKDLTAKLREKTPHFGIEVLSTEVHAQLTQLTEETVYKSVVSVTLFEKSDKEGLKPQERATVLQKVTSTGMSTESMEVAEDKALERALKLLGL